jgi:hypothetical protein
MSARPYKPPPESWPFVALKLVCTVVAIAAVLGFYLAIVLWLVIALNPPEWMSYPLLALCLALSAVTYTLIKSTNLGKYLCDWPRYY